jgi:hypothetical protein
VRFDRAMLLLAWFGVMGYAVSPLWLKQANAAFDRYPPDSLVWFWLRVFEAAHTRENCLRLHNVARWVVMIVMTAGVLAVLILGE